MISQQIKVFLLVAEKGSFSKAADELFMTPAAIMKHMNSLEKRLDVKLLKRTNQGIQLTSAGELLYQDGKRLMQSANRTLDKIKTAKEAEEKTLRLGSSFLNPSSVLTDLWAPLHMQYPEYNFHIVPYTDDTAQIPATLEALGSKYDLIAGTLINSDRIHSLANHLKLGEYDLCVALPARHPLANKKKLTCKDLYGKHLMMVNSDDTAPMSTFHDMLQEKHPQIFIDFVGYYYDINTFNLCEQTNSILLTLTAWKNIHPSLVTIPVDWDFKVPHVPYGISYAKEPSKAVADFIEIIKNKLIQ